MSLYSIRKYSLLIIILFTVGIYSQFTYSNPLTVGMKTGLKELAKYSEKFGKEFKGLSKVATPALVDSLVKTADASAGAKLVSSALFKNIEDAAKGFDSGTSTRIQKSLENFLLAHTNADTQATRFLDEIAEEIQFSKRAEFRAADNSPRPDIVIARLLDCSTASAKSDHKTQLMAFEGDLGKSVDAFYKNPLSKNTSTAKNAGLVPPKGVSNPSSLEAARLEQFMLANRQGIDSATLSTITKQAGGTKNMFDENGLLKNEWSFIRAIYGDPVAAKALKNEADSLKNLSGETFRSQLIDNIIRNAEAKGLPPHLVDTLKGCYKI